MDIGINTSVPTFLKIFNHNTYLKQKWLSFSCDTHPVSSKLLYSVDVFRISVGLRKIPAVDFHGSPQPLRAYAEVALK
jgi:hypothetical protein